MNAKLLFWHIFPSLRAGSPVCKQAIFHITITQTGLHESTQVGILVAKEVKLEVNFFQIVLQTIPGLELIPPQKFRIGVNSMKSLWMKT